MMMMIKSNKNLQAEPRLILSIAFSLVSIAFIFLSTANSSRPYSTSVQFLNLSILLSVILLLISSLILSLFLFLL